MLYFISDIHFGHKAIIDQCLRSFSSIEEMDLTIIKNWNQKVNARDIIYILGDLIHKSEKPQEWYLDRLNGKKILIKGNHDEAMLQRVDPSRYFTEVQDSKVIELHGHSVTLCHYPMLEWKNSRKYGSRKLGYLIHGHTHVRVSPLYHTLFSQGNALNAGVDINGFRPVSFDELLVNNERFKLSTMTDPVDKALFLCRSRHMHRCDLSGVAYADHLIHVAEAFHDPTYKIVALLQDTLSDTELSPQRIGELFGSTVLSAVETLTHRDGEEYFSYILRVKNDPIARAVKMAALQHNMDLSRLKRVTDADLIRTAKYQKALNLLSI